MSKTSIPRAVNNGDIVKEGYLKKLKTMRRKYFVLRGDTPDNPARLEYYDSERKFKSNGAPKRSITLKTCFNINKRCDTRQKNVIDLYTKNDCFSIVFESDEKLEDWFKSLLELQIGEAAPEGDPIRPNFEHVWQVKVCDRGLSAKTGTGVFRLCLTDRYLSLIGPITEEKVNTFDFSLQKIRLCGSTKNFFFLEVGQYTVTGAGRLWMLAEDAVIAENMEITIINSCVRMKNHEATQNQLKYRDRSSSATESSRPITLIHRWPTHTASSGSSGGGGSGALGVNHQRTYSFPLSPIPPTRRASTGTRPNKHLISTSPSSLSGGRDRSDSMPSRARATSECVAHHTRVKHSSFNDRCMSYSPPVISSPLSPASAGCSTDSAGSSLSMDSDAVDGQIEETIGRYCHSSTPDEPILEEDDYGHWSGIQEDEKLNNYVHPDHCNTIIEDYKRMVGKSSSPSQGSYLESPCSSSPMEGNYLPMSPAENRSSIYGRMTINHSRGSSLADDGYVPMAPAASDDGYVDMDHGSNRNHRYQSGELSLGSSCSITSGTPSTDIKFSEYPLDKVTSYFSAEDENPNDRPVRAYSVGSRPTNNKNRTELITSNCERTRAFSVGSKNVRPTNSFRLSMMGHQFLSSNSSVEPSDDMMVLDFSKKSRFQRRKKSSNERLSVPGSMSTLSSSSYSTAEGSISPSLAPSPPKSRFSFLAKSPPKIHDIFKSSPPISGYPSPSLCRVPETEPGYVEMTVGNKNEGYVDMKPGEIPVVIKNLSKPRIEKFPIVEPSKPVFSGNNKDDYIDMSLKRKMPIEDNNNSKIVTKNEDYVEMNLGKKYGGDDESDYLNMSGQQKSKPIMIAGGRKSPKAPSYLPLSSPISLQRKRSKDLTPNSTVFAFSPVNSPENFESTAKCPVDARSGTVLYDSHSESDISSMKDGDYVNYVPGDDYVPMEPVRKTSEPFGVKLKPFEKLLSGLGSSISSLAVNEPEEKKPDKELHYASLDLIRSESEDSNRTIKTQSSVESSSSPSPNPEPSSSFNYAEIDFNKSGSSQKTIH